MRFFLFCNLGFGKPLLEEFMRQSVSDRINTYVVIFSVAKSSFIGRQKARWRIWRELHHHTHNCKIIFSSNINSEKFISSITEASIGIVAGFNQIFQQRCIDRFAELVNFHPSILPHYRGAIPSYWTIRRGERKTGFTLHYVTSEIDAGKALFQRTVEISPADDENTLDRKIAADAAPIFGRYLNCKRSQTTFQPRTVSSPYAHSMNYVPSMRDAS